MNDIVSFITFQRKKSKMVIKIFGFFEMETVKIFLIVCKNQNQIIT